MERKRSKDLSTKKKEEEKQANQLKQKK